MAASSLPVPKNISVMPTLARGRSVRGAIKVTTISSTRTRGAGNKLLIVDDEAARTRQLEFNLSCFRIINLHGVTPVVPSPNKSGSGALIFWEELHAHIHPLLQVHLK